MNKSKGFTIIELIVVIAIIAVLASIVMVNVTSYIAGGKDSAIKGNMADLLTNSAVWYDNHSSAYTGFTADTATGCGGPIFAAITGAGGVLACTETATAWCGCATLVTNGTKDPASSVICVDSTGKKSEQAAHTCAATCVSGVCGY